jgi:hypothetical protein
MKSNTADDVSQQYYDYEAFLTADISCVFPHHQYLQAAWEHRVLKLSDRVH